MTSSVKFWTEDNINIKRLVKKVRRRRRGRKTLSTNRSENLNSAHLFLKHELLSIKMFKLNSLLKRAFWDVRFRIFEFPTILLSKSEITGSPWYSPFWLFSDQKMGENCKYRGNFFEFKLKVAFFGIRVFRLFGHAIPAICVGNLYCGIFRLIWLRQENT